MTVDAAVTTPVAGRTTRIALTFTERGAPVRDIQAWLGMAGHLLTLGPVPTGPPAPTGAVDPTDPTLSFAHVHDMQPATRVGYGPTVEFGYAFPRPGRNRLWAQVQRDWRVVTVPMTVDVAAAPTGAG